MKLAVLGSLGVALLSACNPQPVHAEIRNTSTSCQPNSNYLAGGTNCSTVAEVVLAGDAARRHPWLAYVDRIVDGREDDSGPTIAVIVVNGSGKFSSTFSERRDRANLQ